MDCRLQLSPALDELVEARRGLRCVAEGSPPPATTSAFEPLST